MSSLNRKLYRVFTLVIALATAPVAWCSDNRVVTGVQGKVKGNVLNVHDDPSKKSDVKFSLHEGEVVRNKRCEEHDGQEWCKVEERGGRERHGWVLASYLREEHGKSGSSAGQLSGNTSTEYKRGYNDGLKGNEYDEDRHPQDYKDGYRNGEAARNQPQSRSSHSGNGAASKAPSTTAIEACNAFMKGERGHVEGFNPLGGGMFQVTLKYKSGYKVCEVSNEPRVDKFEDL